MTEQELRDSLDEHFTPARPAIHNYVERDRVDTNFRDALHEPGFQVMVYGPTGVGKSSLVWSTLDKLGLTYYRFGFDDGITESNLFPKIMQKLGFEKVTTDKKTYESGTSVLTSAGVKIWNLITFKGAFGANSKKIDEQVFVPYHNDADVDAVAEALMKLDCVLFLDDLEKIKNDDIKKLLAHLGKKMSDLSGSLKTNSKIIYAGISQEVSKLISLDQSLRDRLADQMLEKLHDSEVKQIFTKGWSAVGFDYSEIDLDHIASLCCGYARYAHWIGKQSVLHAFRASRHRLESSDINDAIEFIITRYRDDYQTRIDKATGHKGGHRIREAILYAMAECNEIEVSFDYIVNNASKIRNIDFKKTQISGPLGELKKPARGSLLEDGRMTGYHRFTDLMLKPYIRMLRLGY
ncbi:AAA family ATPase [Pelobacter propionicus]|uniref:ATPase AAA-type core domain-containing protein n=1 Tax=Pelobacter propionicus (strain DSM 2379 / NBRC 103807 / OttBd1) TaxID=338966 RepID=A1AU23_PELPD|nr:AAA family ATPase [Pelobacter propionicus]ABL00844.1 hypothetical protein Ppro_3250 [Pelobacter propionicus DSM 2379]